MESHSLSVPEASELLGISPAAVRQHVASGRLPAVKRAGRWWLEERAVRAMARQRDGAGRPPAAAMAWAIVLLASGDEATAAAMAGRDRYRSRARAWWRDHPLHEHAPRLRARARCERFDAHPSEVERILGRPDVLVTGISAADAVGLVGDRSNAEIYAPAGSRSSIVGDHGLILGKGTVRIRWVPDELWPLLDRGDDRRAPRAAILLDLLEHDDPRARREAGRALSA
jgi:hypothetical protein